MNTYKNEEIKNNANISEGFQTIPNPETKRFIIKIPKIDDKFLDDTSHVLNYKNEPTGINKGIIFHNGVDKTDQLVEANGNGIMIINNVKDSQAIVLTELTKDLDKLDGKEYIKALKALVEQCNSIGLIDKYNSTVKYMETNLRKSPDSNTYVRTNDAMIGFIAKETMIIEGANGTSIFDPNSKQNIIGQKVNVGDILLETKEGDFRKIDREVFKETYLNMDGNKFSQEALDEIASRDKEKELSIS